ncbi:MaoC family dehydratase [Pseudoalteromonas rubra]|uniref:MaoC family dehydratase n=1 Tax=Pseudoalteromonas rubra TaxID=43658 RepID=UPI001BB217FC|nr:MaoC family dehydratase [Pseudoalteromonas rubra]
MPWHNLSAKKPEPEVAIVYTLGKTFRELTIGEQAGHSKTIAETDVYNFAGITGDFNPVHVDEVFAHSFGLQGRIAHAGIAPAMIAPVIGMKLPGVGSMVLSMEIGFHAPIYIGDTIFAKAEVSAKFADTRQVELTLSWHNQRGELVSDGKAVVLPPKAASKKRLAERLRSLDNTETAQEP